MVTVLVHPSRGHVDGRVNLKRSLEKAVRFTDGEVGRSLTSDDRAQLLLRHPSGEARFWGTYEHNRTKIMRVHEGDIVIFTGEGSGWAVGVVGYRFENPDFARAVWQETRGKGTYSHIYSLASFETVEIPYSMINEPLGNSPNNHFQGMAVYDHDGRGDALADALHLTAGQSYSVADGRLEDALQDEVPIDSRLRPIERSNDQTITVSIPQSERLMRRGESMLVAAYAATLGAGVAYGRYFTAVGTTDLWVRDGEHSELIEAKSLPDHRYVRQALAQLLDYGPALPTVPTAAAALFPDRPDVRGIELLHRYGIDCIYRIGPRSYRREPAPDPARDRLMTFWSR